MDKIKFGLVLLLTILVCFGSGFLDQVAANEYDLSVAPEIGYLNGRTLTSIAGSPVREGKVTGNVSGQTQFACSYYANANYGADYYNLSWVIYVIEATNITKGTIIDVTDFASNTGTFTTAAAGASWVVGDKFLLLFGTLGTDLEGSNQLTYQADLTTYGNEDSLYFSSLIGLPDDFPNQKFYLEVTSSLTPTAAPQSEIRQITDFHSSSGLVVLASEFSAAVNVGDRCTIMHKSIAHSQLPGRLEYSGTGEPTETVGSDSVYVAELKGFGDDYFNECNYYVHVIFTTDGGAPLGEYIPVLDYISISGLFTVGLDYGFSADITSGDGIAIVHPSVFSSTRGTAESGIKVHVSNNTANTTTDFYCDELTGYADSSLVGNYVKILYDAAGTHQVPEGEKSKITKFKASTGLITVGTAFGAAPTTGDIVRIYPGDADDIIWGDGGVQNVTAVKLAAGISIAEGLLYVSNVADQCSAFVADGTSEIDTTLENVRAAVATLNTANTNGWQYLTVTALDSTVGDVATNVWFTVATHEVFTISGGPYEAEITAVCNTTFTGADSIHIGYPEGSYLTRLLKTDIDVNEIISINTAPVAGVAYVGFKADPATTMVPAQTESLIQPTYTIIRGDDEVDFGYEVQTATAPAGGITFTIKYRSRDKDDPVVIVAGLGGVL